MHLTERLRARRSTHGSVPAAGPPVTVEDDGTITIDLRDPLAPPGTPTVKAEPCPHCGGPVDVDHVDPVSHTAAMTCRDCGLVFSHRISTS